MKKFVSVTDDFHADLARTQKEKQIAHRNYVYRQHTLNMQHNLHTFGVVTKLLSIVVVALLVAIIIAKYSGNGNLPTFTSFLETLSNSPTLSIPIFNISTFVLNDWGVFNWLRDFISVFMSLINIIIFFANGVLSVLSYIVYFLQWLFY